MKQWWCTYVLYAVVKKPKKFSSQRKQSGGLEIRASSFCHWQFFFSVFKSFFQKWKQIQAVPRYHFSTYIINVLFSGDISKMGGQVSSAPDCYAFEPRHLSKKQNGRHQQRSGQQKIYKKKFKKRYCTCLREPLEEHEWLDGEVCVAVQESLLNDVAVLQGLLQNHILPQNTSSISNI